jgi:hypothetical protein
MLTRSVAVGKIAVRVHASVDEGGPREFFHFNFPRVKDAGAWWLLEGERLIRRLAAWQIVVCWVSAESCKSAVLSVPILMWCASSDVVQIPQND